MVGIYSSRPTGGVDCICDRKFSGHKGGYGKPGEEFKNRVGSSYAKADGLTKINQASKHQT
jgi:hypothetical protein